jgi:hypothetical protein
VLTCLHCRATTNGVVLCTRCRTTAEVALDNLAAYHADLFSLPTNNVRIRRRSGPADPTGNLIAVGDGGGGVEAAAAETNTMLTAWCRILLDTRTQLRPPPDSVTGKAAFLRQHLNSIATLEWAGELVRQLLRFERRLHKIVSANRGQWYAGICGGRTGDALDDWCPVDLFIRTSETWVRCPACGTGWSVDQRRRRVIEQARDELLPVSLIARAAVSLLEGEPSHQRLEARLHKWVQRGQLEDYGVRVVDGRPVRVYRLGDVLDRLVTEVRPAGPLLTQGVGA